MSAICPPLRLPWVRFGRALNFVRHVSALPCVHHVSPKALALPLDFARPWPAVGQGQGIIRQNSFVPLRSPQRLYCMPAGGFPSYIHFCSPNWAFTSALYACKTVWGLRVYAGIIVCLKGLSTPSLVPFFLPPKPKILNPKSKPQSSP